MNGNPAKNAIGEPNDPTISGRFDIISWNVRLSTYGPTDTQLQVMDLVDDLYEESVTTYNSIREELRAVADEIMEAGGPWVEGLD